MLLATIVVIAIFLVMSLKFYVLTLISLVSHYWYFSFVVYLQKPGGIIALLDEAWWVRNLRCFLLFCFRITKRNVSEARLSFCSMFPRSTHETFAQKLYQTYKNHKRFTKPKLARSDFTICHYAGDVSFFCLSAAFIGSHDCESQYIWFVNISFNNHEGIVTGHLSDRVFPRQEQGLCYRWASSVVKCFYMFLCCKLVPTSIWRFQTIKILLYRYPFQGESDFGLHCQLSRFLNLFIFSKVTESMFVLLCSNNWYHCLRFSIQQSHIISDV